MSEVIKDLVTAAQAFVHWRVIGAFVVLFDVLLVAAYLFVSTREANAVQLLLTLVMAMVVLTVFFIMQAMGVSYAARIGSIGQLLRDAVRGFWRLAVATLPVVLLGALLVYLFAKVDPGAWSAGDESGIAWKRIFLTALEDFIFASRCRCWPFVRIAAAHGGLAATARNSPRVNRRLRRRRRAFTAWPFDVLRGSVFSVNHAQAAQ
ncbi:MAG: hypothetical protein WKF30_08730 [Pyrinomonadaceae bacterium]